jgi:hypothetical protein
MKKVIVPVVAALLFATAGQAQMATKQATTKPVTASSKTTVHKPVSTASVSPTTTTSKPATTTGTSATTIKRKHHHKAQKTVQKKTN